MRVPGRTPQRRQLGSPRGARERGGLRLAAHQEPSLGLSLLPVPQKTLQLALGAGWEDSEQKLICPGVPSFVLARVEPGRSPPQNNFPCSWS